MAKPNRTGRNSGQGQFFMMFEYVMASDAYRHLSTTGRALLVEFCRRYMKDRTQSNRITMSVRDAAQLINVGKNYAGAVLRELQDHGFIAVIDASAFNVKSAHGTVYRLTHLGPPAEQTKDFMSWQPPEENPRSLHKGLASTSTRDWKSKSVPPQGTDSTSTRDWKGGSDDRSSTSTRDTSIYSHRVGASGAVAGRPESNSRDPQKRSGNPSKANGSVDDQRVVCIKTIISELEYEGDIVSVVTVSRRLEAMGLPPASAAELGKIEPSRAS